MPRLVHRLASACFALGLLYSTHAQARTREEAIVPNIVEAQSTIFFLESEDDIAKLLTPEIKSRHLSLHLGLASREITVTRFGLAIDLDFYRSLEKKNVVLGIIESYRQFGIPVFMYARWYREHDNVHCYGFRVIETIEYGLAQELLGALPEYDCAQLGAQVTNEVLIQKLGYQLLEIYLNKRSSTW